MVEPAPAEQWETRTEDVLAGLVRLVNDLNDTLSQVEVALSGNDRSTLFSPEDLMALQGIDFVKQALDDLATVLDDMSSDTAFSAANAASKVKLEIVRKYLDHSGNADDHAARSASHVDLF